LYTLPHTDLELLERLGYKQKLADVDDAILSNQQFLNQIVANPEIFGHDVSSLADGDDESSSEIDYPMESHTHTAG
jgi:carnosine N-methyltransferase